MAKMTSSFACIVSTDGDTRPSFIRQCVDHSSFGLFCGESMLNRSAIESQITLVAIVFIFETMPIFNDQRLNLPQQQRKNKLQKSSGFCVDVEYACRLTNTIALRCMQLPNGTHLSVRRFQNSQLNMVGQMQSGTWDRTIFFLFQHSERSRCC